jgi:hypothetical protein
MKINNILIIGDFNPTDHVIDWCNKNKINYKAINPIMPRQNSYPNFQNLRHIYQEKRAHVRKHKSIELTSDVFFSDKLFQWFLDNQFAPEWIINLYDDQVILEVEKRIGKWFQCKNAINQEQCDFFGHKSVQDKVCKSLGVPTFPKTSELGCCVKRDANFYNWSGGEIPPKMRWEPVGYVAKPGEFVQGWVDIEKVFQTTLTIDAEGVYVLYDTSCDYYQHHMVVNCMNPYQFINDELDQIQDSLMKFAKGLNIRSRAGNFQFAKCHGDDTLYIMDLNCRLTGEAYLKHDTGKTIQFEYLLGLWDHTHFPSVNDWTDRFFGETAYSIFSKQKNGGQIKPIPRHKMKWWIDTSVAYSWKFASSPGRVPVLFINPNEN